MPIRQTIRTTKRLYTLFKQTSVHYSTASYPVPHLPVLEKMVETAQQIPEFPDLKDTAVLGTQHFQETTARLLSSIIRLGTKPHNMFVSGKCYSTSPIIAKTIEEMGINVVSGSVPSHAGGYQSAAKKDAREQWARFEETAKNRNIERVVIVDDGARSIEYMPKYIPFRYFAASIEQTRGGLYSSSLERLYSPLIEVATSAVKKHIESPMIAEAVLNRVKKLLPSLNLNENTVCGVIGNGAIGNAIANYLLSKGYPVAVYDENTTAFQNVTNKNLVRMPDMESIITYCSHVFGCTGTDITKKINLFDVVENDITLISCTSEDREFLTLLQKIAEEGRRIYFEPLADITCLSNKGNKILILKGGFPINFDREPWNVPAKDIEVTQGLMLGAFLQAVLTASKLANDGVTINHQKRQMLDPYLQQFVLKEWFKHQSNQRYSQELLIKFDDVDWIKENSGGVYYPNPAFSTYFNVENGMKNDEYPRLSR